MADPEASAPPQLDMSTAVTDTDQGIVVTIACWLSLVCSMILFGARLYIRWPLKSLFGRDDAICAVSMSAAVIQTALVLSAVDSGFGVTRDDLSAGTALTIEKTIWTSDLFFVLSVACGKLATAALLLRFCAAPDRTRVLQILTYAVGVSGIVGIFITALRQNTLHPWRYTAGTVDSNLYRWIAFGSMGIVADLVLMVAPIYLLWEVQMTRWNKATVVIAFASRAPTIILTILRLVSISNLDGSDFTLAYVTPEIYTQLEMHYSLISATIPCIRIFLRAWHTRFLNMALEELDEQAYVEHTTAQGSYNMDSMDKSKSRTNGQRKGKNSIMRSNDSKWLSNRAQGVSQATVGGGRDDDATSENSQKAIVIKHTVDVDVGWSGGDHPGR